VAHLAQVLSFLSVADPQLLVSSATSAMHPGAARPFIRGHIPGSLRVHCGTLAQPSVGNHDAMRTVEIVTERLVVRPFRVDDLDAFVAYRSDPEVARYQSWDSPYSMADAESFLRSLRGLVFGQPGEGLQLAIVDRASGAVCGDCVVRVVTDQPETAEIGVTLARASQGKGLATEALTAVLTDCSSGVASIESSPRPTIATVRFGVYSSAWASAARRARWRPTGSRANGRRCAFTRC
jgi:RimJ/RimL family protein N-acetyltransferase